MGGGFTMTGARRKQDARPPFKLPRAEWLIAVTLAFVVLLLGWLAVQVVSLTQDLRTSNSARDALARQVQGLGASPVAGPPGSRGTPGGIGPSGRPGSPGPTGRPGEDGKNGRDGADGSPGPSGSPGRPGDDGANGSDGANGADGSNGSDGAVGPAGPAGPEGPQGAQGPQGEKGDKGEAGDRGPAGPGCPDGYILQAPSYDPDALVCRRDGAPDQQPSDTSGTGLLGLPIDRRRY
jgi:hypothetical protein